MQQLIPKRPLRSRRRDQSAQVAKTDFLFTCERLQNLALARREIMGHTVWRDVAAGQEAHTHRAGLLDELRLGVSCLDTQLDDLLRAAAPSFHKAPPIEGFRDERIPRPGQVVPLQVIDTQPKRQSAVAPDLQAIIIDRQTHRTPRNRIVAVAESVHERFTQGYGWEQRRIGAFEHARFYAASNWQMPGEKLHRLFQQLQRMAVGLSLVQELSFVGATKTGHPQLALRIVR